MKERKMSAVSTKEKILVRAADLFARNGYTETSIRALAAAVGIKEASIYNHFPSKNAILETILQYYADFSALDFEQTRLSVLKANPTPMGILSSLTVRFPEEKKELLTKSLFVILQEQYRNPMVRTFVARQIIVQAEGYITAILDMLKEIQAIRQDMDIDFWVKLHSSIVYSYANRAVLDYGDTSPGYTGMGMKEMLLRMYEIMFQIYGIRAADNPPAA